MLCGSVHAIEENKESSGNEVIKLLISDSLRELINGQSTRNPYVTTLLDNAADEDRIIAKINEAREQSSLIKAISYLRGAGQCDVASSGEVTLTRGNVDDTMEIIERENKHLFAPIREAISYLVKLIIAKGKLDCSYEWLIKFSDTHIWSGKIEPTTRSIAHIHRKIFLIKLKNYRNVIDL